jgi:hypothetical protein
MRASRSGRRSAPSPRDRKLVRPAPGLSRPDPPGLPPRASSSTAVTGRSRRPSHGTISDDRSGQLRARSWHEPPSGPPLLPVPLFRHNPNRTRPHDDPCRTIAVPAAEIEAQRCEALGLACTQVPRLLECLAQCRLPIVDTSSTTWLTRWSAWPRAYWRFCKSRGRRPVRTEATATRCCRSA